MIEKWEASQTATLGLTGLSVQILYWICFGPGRVIEYKIKINPENYVDWVGLKLNKPRLNQENRMGMGQVSVSLVGLNRGPTRCICNLKS